jgi:hypothetical protein
MARGERTIVQGGRAKAFRPMPGPEREAALEAGLAAYERADFFLAHELLEPAWMGAEDLAERELLQGLIKLAAAFVHDSRSNPAGMAKNMRGAADRLAGAGPAGPGMGIDVAALQEAIGRRLAEIGRGAADAGGVADAGGSLSARAIPIPRRRSR